MKKSSLIILLTAASFLSGFAFKAALISGKDNHPQTFKKVTGIGGIFFKSRDPKKLREWYQANLGLNTNQYGTVFEWYQGADSTKKGFSQWSPFNEKTKYFDKDYMINFRVENMDALVAELKRSGVTIADSVQSANYGKFVHIIDLEGNKLELWEPNDVEYEKLGKQMGAKTTK